MAFGDSGILDNFNRANGALGASWSSPVYSGDGAMVVSSNQCAPNADGFHDSNWASSFSANQEVWATVATKASANTDLMYLFARLANPNNASLDGYVLMVEVASGADVWSLRRIDNAVETTLGSTFTQEVSAGDAIGLRCNGTSIEAWYRASGGSWTQLATRTDNTYNASGYIGLGTSDSTTRYDDFGGGVIVDDVFEQEGFRWGVDDGSESAHGWQADQDTSITLEDDRARLLRLVLNATGNPGAVAPVLRSQKNGSGGYTAVPVGATSEVTPVIESGDATGTTVGTAGSTWAINFPAASNGDLLIALVAWDDSTNVTSVTAPAGPNSETANSIVGPVASASTEMRMQAWYWVATGAWSSGTRTFTPAASETCRAVVVRVPAGEFDATTPIGWSGSAASAGTAESTVASPTGTAGSTDGGGRLLIAYGSDADAITAPASGTSTVNNATGGGVGLCVVTRNTAVSDSESIAAITATIASDSWASLALVVRAPTINNEVYISTSGNIAAGGEATTARLAAPSGKTSGADFFTGRRWDDENGTDTLDLGADDYTEVEWSVYIAASAANGDYYDFRAYIGAVALATYTVTPRWTVGVNVAVSESTAPAVGWPTSEGVSTGGGTDTTVTETVALALAAPASEGASVGSTLTETGAQSTAWPVSEAVTTSGDVTITESAGAAMALPGQETVALSVALAEVVRLAVAPPTPREFVTVADYALRFYGGGNSSTVDKVYIPCRPGDAINVGQGDFTVEFWVRAPASLAAGSATAGANYSWINSPIIFDRDLLGDVGSGGDWGVSMTGGRITFGLENSAGSQRTIIGTTDLRDDAWHHVAVTRQRSSGDMAVYVDGAREAYQASGPSGDVHVASDADASTYNQYMCLGGEKHAIDWPAGQWVGRLDEVRISSSLRYTGTTYTEPSAPFATDANTVGLFAANQGTGTTVRDSSGVYLGADGSFTVGGSGPGPEWVLSDVFGGVTVTESTSATAAWPVMDGTSAGTTVTERPAFALSAPASESTSTGTTISEAAALACAWQVSETVVTGIVVSESLATATAWPASEAVSTGRTLGEVVAVAAAWPASEGVSTVSGTIIAETLAGAWAWRASEAVATGTTIGEVAGLTAIWPAVENISLSAGVTEAASLAAAWPVADAPATGSTIAELAAFAVAWPAMESIDTSVQNVARYQLRPRRGNQIDGDYRARLAPRKGKRIA